MENIFEGAKFGDKFITESGDILHYINEKPHGRFNLYCELFNSIHTYNTNGIIKDKNGFGWLNIICCYDPI